MTDGALRDTPEIASLELPVFARAASPLTNLVQHHATDINVPIGCAEVPIYPGDIMVGDEEGVVCVPRHLATEVAEAAHEQERLERFIQHEIADGQAAARDLPAGRGHAQALPRVRLLALATPRLTGRPAQSAPANGGSYAPC